MERKIGEKFTIDDKTYIVIESNEAFCRECAFRPKCNFNISNGLGGPCSSETRSDETNVIFKEVEQNNINMKPFNLEQAKAGKPVCTRDGREARILCFDLNKKSYPIAAAITLEEGNESVEVFTIDGEYDPDIYDKDLDLMMVTEQKKGWINVYRYSENNYGEVLAKTATVYSTKEIALSHIAKDMSYIGTFPFEWEE